MAGKTVLIACRLPHGVILRHPVTDERVEIAGLNKSLVIGAEHVTTPVDAEYWGAWKTSNKDSDLIKSFALFEAKSGGDAGAIANELKDVKTGFEKMPQEAPGIKKADEKDPE